MVVGFSSPAQDMIADNVSLHRYLVPHPLNSMFVEMSGNSMRGVVNTADLLIVERSNQANPGQIVLAQIDGQYMIRFLGRDRNGFLLYGTMRNEQPVRPSTDIAIVGIVTGLARRFQSNTPKRKESS
ncbi:MAG: S24 family peptidase [bacterium]|nr:S24 family peptidase [bacterium]